MDAILNQLGLDATFFIQFGIFALLFLALSQVYFKPFLALIEARHRRTVEDRERAQALADQAQKTLAEYRQKLAAERSKVRAEIDALVAEAKNEEAKILAGAREEARKITQSASERLAREGAELRTSLQGDVEQLAQTVSQKLLGGL